MWRTGSKHAGISKNVAIMKFFCHKNFFIHGIFSNFTKILNHENLELHVYGTLWTPPFNKVA